MDLHERPEADVMKQLTSAIVIEQRQVRGINGQMWEAIWT